MGIGSVLWSMVDQRRMLLPSCVGRFRSPYHLPKAFTRLLDWNGCLLVPTH